MITLHFHLFPCWRNYRLKSSETIQLIIWALESRNIRSYGVGPTSTLSDIACNLFCHQRSREWWIHWCNCSSRHKSCWIYSFSLIITTTSVSGNDRFRDSAFTPAFFGAEAAEMLLRFWPPQAFTLFATQFRWIPRAKQWWQTLFRPKKWQSHVNFPFLKHCPQRISCLWNPGETGQGSAQSWHFPEDLLVPLWKSCHLALKGRWRRKLTALSWAEEMDNDVILKLKYLL